MEIRELGEEFAKFFIVSSLPPSRTYSNSLPIASTSSVAAHPSSFTLPFFIRDSRGQQQQHRVNPQANQISKTPAKHKRIKSCLLSTTSKLDHVPKRVRFNDTGNVIHWIPRHNSVIPRRPFLSLEWRRQ